MKTGQSSASGRSPLRLWNARPRFFLTWTFPFPLLPDLSSHLTYSLLLYFHTWNGFFVSFTVTLSIFLLLENPRPQFSPCWEIYLSIFATPIHNAYDFIILKTRKPDQTLFAIETQPSFFFPSHAVLCRTHLSVFGVPPSRSARPQIHGNRGEWRNSHKPHWLFGAPRAYFRQKLKINK